MSRGSETTPQPPVRRDRRLRRNSIPLAIHGVFEYCAGLLSIVGPFLFSFDSDVAKVVSILLGAGIIVMAVMTASPTGIVRSLPIESHIVLDYVISLFLIVSPFIFGFTDDAAPTAYFIVLGLVYLLVTVTTRYHKHARA